VLPSYRIDYQVNLDFTVYALMADIEDKTDIPWYEQRLIFAGQQLSGHETLRSYGVSAGSVLHFIRWPTPMTHSDLPVRSGPSSTRAESTEGSSAESDSDGESAA
jgi:ubiquitin-like protein Nedd8